MWVRFRGCWRSRFILAVAAAILAGRLGFEVSVPFLTGLDSVDGDKRGTPGATARGRSLTQLCGWIRRARGGAKNQVRNRFSVQRRVITESFGAAQSQQSEQMVPGHGASCAVPKASLLGSGAELQLYWNHSLSDKHAEGQGDVKGPCCGDAPAVLRQGQRAQRGPLAGTTLGKPLCCPWQGRACGACDLPALLFRLLFVVPVVPGAVGSLACWVARVC